MPQVSFDNSKSVISNFDMLSPNDASRLLCAMGLASVPTWIRPYNTLSNGEQYRAQVAKLVAQSKDEIILVDEFTSVVDRNVAMAMSNALSKYIRRENKRIILASCHYDILEWLRPDWIYDLNKGGALERGDYPSQRPPISLQVYRVEYDTWRIFAKHHYMTQEMNTSCACYAFTWNDKLVAFCSVLPMPSGTLANGVRGSRTVVLPDFQGLGIGSKISEFIASIYKAQGYRYYTKTINPRLGEYRNSSPNWKGTSFNGKVREKGLVDKQGRHYLARKSYCHEYIGAPTFGYENLTLPIDKMRYNLSMEGQLSFNF